MTRRLRLPRRQPVYSSAAAVWTPAQLSGIQLYIDVANSSVTMDGSNLVSQWNDISGNSRHLTQATGTNQPLYIANDGDALPVIHFGHAGLDDFLASPSFTLSAPTTIVVVAKLPTRNNGKQHWGTNTLSSMQFTDNTTGNFMFNGVSATAFTDWATGVYKLLRCEYNTTSSIYQVGNGTARTGLSTGTNSSTTGWRLGTNSAGAGSAADTKVRAAFILNRALDAGDVTNIQAWASSRFGAGVL